MAVLSPWKRKGKRKKKYYNTGYSYLVTHPSTNDAKRGLTLLSGRHMLLSLWYSREFKGPGKRGHIVADTLLPMMFLGLRKLGNFCCGHKMFLNKIRNIFCVRNKCCARGQTGKHLCRQQCVRNNVSSFATAFKKLLRRRRRQSRLKNEFMFYLRISEYS